MPTRTSAEDAGPLAEYLQYAETAQELQREFESRLFWLAGGVLVLVLGGAQSLAATKPLESASMLVHGACCLFLGLIAAMVGFRVSALAYNRLAEHYHDRDAAKYQEAMRLQPIMAVCDWLSLVLVVLGVALCGIFYLHNIVS